MPKVNDYLESQGMSSICIMLSIDDKKKWYTIFMRISSYSLDDEISTVIYERKIGNQPQQERCIKMSAL